MPDKFKEMNPTDDYYGWVIESVQLNPAQGRVNTILNPVAHFKARQFSITGKWGSEGKLIKIGTGLITTGCKWHT